VRVWTSACVRYIEYQLLLALNWRSTMIGLPEIEILEGPPELTLSIKEAQVLPRRQGCAAPVAGGKLMLSATVTEQMEAKLIFRVKYKTKDGDRQMSNSYIVSLFPRIYAPLTSPINSRRLIAAPRL
jgi:hypothetical protein